MLAYGWDDDDLLVALRQAVRERQAVPPELVEAARSAFAWRNFDAEPARLSYDSARDGGRAASMRAGPGSRARGARRRARVNRHVGAPEHRA